MSRPVVSLSKLARLEGRVNYLRDLDKPVYAFLGIPYAEPPIGKLRFKRTRSLTSLWSGDRDASKFGAVCPQNLSTFRLTYKHFPTVLPSMMSEDCLYLNVWTPTRDPASKLPVMVWFHGGGFVHGFSDHYDGTAMAGLGNVVHVSVNYRLGAFGFLTTGDELAPGNAGLLDQVEALRWLQTHIHNFGGDADNVTIFGESAGGISCSLHMLSPLTKGLFHRVICQSGFALHPAVVWSLENTKKYIDAMLKPSGFTVSTPEQLISHLNNKSSSEIVDTFGDGFQPVVDGFYLPDHPYTLYSSDKFRPAQMMIGFNSDEGALFLLHLSGVDLKDITSLDIARMIIDFSIKKIHFRGHPKAEEVSQAVWKEYFNDGDVAMSPETIQKTLSDMIGDVLFVAPSIQGALWNSGKAATYMYQFSHRPSTSNLPAWIRADHCHEVPYVFGQAFIRHIKDVFTDEEKLLSRKLIQLWTNFARTGDPNGTGVPEWPRYTPQTRLHLVLATTSHVTDNHTPRRMEFWNKQIRDISEGNGKSKY